MELFLQIALSFPTVVFTVLLGVALCYWLLAMLGMIDLDIFDVSHAHVHGHGGEHVELGGVAGLLMKFGLDGVPLTLIFSVITLIAWVLSYLAARFFLLPLAPDAFRWMIGGGIVLGAFLLAVPMAGVALRPLRSLFAKIKPVTSESLLGKPAIVRSPVVTPQQGQAAMEDGGAGLILQVRADAGLFKRGDRVVLVEYLEAQNAYRIIKD